MLIEATEKAFTYRWPDGEVYLEPGKPVDLPEHRVRRLLAKAPGRVRIVSGPGACYACGKIRYWVSTQDKIICAVCHPPASIAALKEWL